VRRKQRANRASKLAGAFAVNDADLRNASSLALGEVLDDQVFYFTRLEGVQIQDTIDGKPNGIVHCNRKLRKNCIFRHGF
jgi:hypothetical protein